MAALRSHAEADEAAQDAWVQAWRRLDTFRGDAAFRTWILAIAWHAAINRRRGVVRWWKRMMPLDDHEARLRPDTTSGSQRSVASAFSQTSGASDPEQLASSDQLRRRIGSAIRELSPTLRDTLLLAQSGEYTDDEIGRRIGAPGGTIKWRVVEARRQVRKRLQAVGYVELG